MRPAALAVLGCPRCFGPLTTESDAVASGNGRLSCKNDGTDFNIQSGIPQLIRPERLARTESFDRFYGRSKGRWNPTGSQLKRLRDLPYLHYFSPNGIIWRAKARTMEALMAFFASRPPKRVLDLGCGVGWLSSQLARRGYDTYAVDAVSASPTGLLGAELYFRNGVYFERIRGEIEFPPFQDRSFDAVVCNASIHYTNALRESLLQVHRILSEGGVFIMMNSPVHLDAGSADLAQEDARLLMVRSGAPLEVASTYHHYSSGEVRDAFCGVFGTLQEIPWSPGLDFRVLRRFKGMLLRMELASFPILWARKVAV